MTRTIEEIREAALSLGAWSIPGDVNPVRQHEATLRDAIDELSDSRKAIAAAMERIAELEGRLDAVQDLPRDWWSEREKIDTDVARAYLQGRYEAANELSDALSQKEETE